MSDELVKCPWCTNQHGIVQKRLEKHYSTLKLNNDPCVKNLRSCKYNRHHKFHKKDEKQHYDECKDAKKFGAQETLRASCMGTEKNEMAFSANEDIETIGTCEESWDEPYEESWDDVGFTNRRISKNSELYKVPQNYHAMYEEIRPSPQLLEKAPMVAVITQAPEDIGVADDKKQRRKLEKKLKEIQKLEKRAAENGTKANLTKEEMEKMSKKCEIERELEALKSEKGHLD